MKLGTKHRNQKTVLYTDFSGGLNTSVPPDLLKLNELQVANNFEFDVHSGMFKTRTGLTRLGTPASDTDMTSLFYSYDLEQLLLAVGSSLYVYDGTSFSLIDSFDGGKIPVFADWDGKVVIASGGHLQEYDGTSLTTISSSPLCDFVFSKHGRVGITNTGSDYISFSGVGDASNWNFAGTDSDAQQIEVGYKEGGDIVGIRPFFDDLIVFKDNHRMYRLVGWYPDWDVKEVTRGHGTLNRFSSYVIGSSIVFVDYEGVISLSPTVEYGDFAFKQVGDKINNYFKLNLDEATAKVFHLPKNGQIWCMASNSNIVYVFHYLIGAWTRFIFSDAVNYAMSCPLGNLVCMGDSLYRLDPDVSTDDGTAFQSSVYFPRKLGSRDLLVKYITFIYKSGGSGTGTLTVGKFVYNFNLQQTGDIAYSDTDIIDSDSDPLVSTDDIVLKKRTNIRESIVEPQIVVNSGRLGIVALYLEVADV